MSFTAKYRSNCPLCDLDIKPGDEIVYAAFDEVVHVKCPSDPSNLQRSVCTQCFEELPVSGVCGNCA